MYIHLEHDDLTDPRILRTRELLVNSFAKLLIEHKSIKKISVQSVTKLAGVNRVTFYAHFADKYELLDLWARLMFRQSVIEKLPENSQLDNECLTLLINSTLDFFIVRSQYLRRINQQFESMFEAAVQQELEVTLQSMLNKTHITKQLCYTGNVAKFLSWAIFGSLITWDQNKIVQSKETLATEIISMCETVLTSLTQIESFSEIDDKA